MPQILHCPACAWQGPCANVATFPGSQGDYELFKCCRCGLIFVHPMPQLQEHFHGEDSGRVQQWEVREDVMQTRLAYSRHLINELSQHVRPPASLLDFGCGYGEFLQAAIDKGYCAYGVDVSRSCVEYIRDRMPAVTVASSLEELPIGTGQFDAITAIECLYYMPDPLGILRRLSGYLKENGKLFIVTSGNRGWPIWVFSLMIGAPVFLRPGAFLTRALLNNRAYYGFTSKSLTAMMHTIGLVDLKRINSLGARIHRPAMRVLLGSWDLVARLVAKVTLDRLDFATKINMIGTIRRQETIGIHAQNKG